MPPLLVGIVMVLSSCASKNLMAYYYPMNREAEVKIYKYVNPKDKKLNEYWKVSTDPRTNTLLTESYNSKFKLYNTFEEKILDSKIELLKYTDYEEGATHMMKEVNAIIKKNQVYQSSRTDSYAYAVEYTNQHGRVTFEKKRVFLGFEPIEIQGKKYETAKFKDEYFVSARDQKDSYGFSQLAFYAKGLGMVKYERSLPTGEIRILELEKIMSEKELIEIQKNRN